MTTPRKIVSAAFSTIVFAALMAPLAATAQQPEPYPREDFEQLLKDVSNWGRWGENDELGAINHITPEKRVRAAGLVRTGISVSLAHDLVKEKDIDAPYPFEHQMLLTGHDNDLPWALDRYAISYHGYIHTHMDALCHMFADGKMYNGFPQEGVGDSGAERLSIINLKDGIFTRGVLFDIPKLKGVPYLEPGEAIYPADFEAWEKRAGFKVEPGDVVLVRTGRWTRRAAKGPWDSSTHSPGLYPTCMKWLHDRGVAVIGCDATSDLLPPPVEGETAPIHRLALIAMGMPILDNCDLDELAEQAEKHARWEFQITVAPLAVPGGTGSPLNPIATF